MQAKFKPLNPLKERSNINPEDVDICLLLTATIDPDGMILTARNNPKVRLEDYKQGLKFWLQTRGLSKIVFCENSNHDLEELREVAKNHNDQNKLIEFFSFYGQNFSKELGKGYGELNILSYALSHSKLITSETKIVKATGRYIIKNVSQLICFVRENPKADIICDLSQNLFWSDSRIFVCSTAFIEKSLLPLQNQLDESKGINFEMTLARAVHRGIGEGQLWMLPPCLPEVFGVFGTTDTAYKRIFLKDLLRRIIYSIKRFFFALSN